MTFCRNCSASLTTTDFDCGFCTQCKVSIIAKETMMTVTTRGLKFDEIQSYGMPAFLNITYKGVRVGRFYFNMRGYVPDFQLRNKEGAGAGFGERGKSTQIRELKRWIREGFDQLTPFD